jgi:hypothetical protein
MSAEAEGLDSKSAADVAASLADVLETNAYRIVIAEQQDGRWQITLLQNSVP